MNTLLKQLFLIFLSVSLLIACSKSEDTSQKKKLDPLEVVITPEIQNKLKQIW